MTLTVRELECTCAGPPSPSQATGAPEPAAARSKGRRIWALLIAAAVLASALAAGAGEGALLKPEGSSAFAEFFAASLHPRLDGGFLLMTVNAALTTLSYAVLGTALSIVIGLAGGVLSSQTWWSASAGRPRPWRAAGWVMTRALLVVPRGIHEVVWGLFFLVVFGLDPIVAVLAIGIPFGAVTAKMFSEILDETSRGPYSALRAAGSNRRTAMLYGLLPPALSDLLSYSFYRFECAIRSAAILGLVGAGGLGFQLALSFQTLRYDEIWTLLYALIFLSVAAEFWSSTVRRRRSDRQHASLGRDRVLTGSLIGAALLIVLSAWWIGLDAAVVFSGHAWEMGAQVLAQAWPPALDPVGLGELGRLSALTLAMSILAAAIAFGGGALLSLPAAGNTSWRRRPRPGLPASVGRIVVQLASRLLLVVLRAIPPPVWALLFLFVFYPGLLPGALALGVYTAGVLGRLMAETTENLDPRPLQALRSHGSGGLQVLCYGVIPAAIPRFVAYGLYRWEVTIRETVVVGVVGAGGLGLALQHDLSGFRYQGALSILLAILVLTLIVDFASAALRKALR